MLGRREITDFDDLADRRVAIGREGSGTYLTARLLFKTSEVAPKEMVPIDTDEALAELKAGADRRHVLRGGVSREAAHREGGRRRTGSRSSRSPTRASSSSIRPRRFPPARTRGSRRRCRRPRSRPCSSRSTSGRGTVTSSAGSPRPSRPTWSGSSRTAIRSGKRSTSTSRSRAGTSTTASRSTCGGPAGPPRRRRAPAPPNPVLDAMKSMLGN